MLLHLAENNFETIDFAYVFIFFSQVRGEHAKTFYLT